MLEVPGRPARPATGHTKRRQHGRRRVCRSAAPILALATLIPALGLVTDGTAGAATSSCTTYTSPATGSHQVCGAIRTKYLALGGPAGFLGYPVTNELPTPDGIGRFNHFANSGSIYWTPSTGAWSIHGAIRAKWASLGWERGVLGYPVTDETGTPDHVGRFNHFSSNGVHLLDAVHRRLVDPRRHQHQVRSARRTDELSRLSRHRRDGDARRHRTLQPLQQQRIDLLDAVDRGAVGPRRDSGQMGHHGLGAQLRGIPGERRVRHPERSGEHLPGGRHHLRLRLGAGDGQV